MCVRPAYFFGAILLGGCLIALLGCARSKPSRFYLLSPLIKTAASPSSAPKHTMAIGLGPLTLADYLDRPQIVLRSSDEGPLRLAEFDRWAEPLKDSFENTLRENLSAALKTDQIVIALWNQSRPVDRQVELEVTRLDGEPGAEAVLEARWTLDGPDGKILLAARKAAYREAVPGKTCQDLVAAESRLVAALCKDIAAAIQGTF